MTTVEFGALAQSPFDSSGTQFAWDSTSLGWLKECPRKYFYSMVEGWRSKAEAIDLVFGIWYHDGLETYDRLRATGETHNSAVCLVVRHLLAASWVEQPDGTMAGWAHDNPKKAAKSRWGLIRSVVWYLEEFGDNDPAQTITLSTGKPAVELSFRFEVEHSLILCGHLDRVVDYGGDSFVMDRKTTGGTLSAHYFKQYSPHNQMTLYSLAGRVAFGSPVKGVIIDAAQIAVGSTRFMRGFAHRTERQLEEFLDGVYALRRTAELYTERKHWPLNETACDKFGGCVFRDICNKDPAIRGKFLAGQFSQHLRWNPLVSREK